MLTVQRRQTLTLPPSLPPSLSLSSQLKKEVTLGKKTLQATTLRLNKTVKEKEAEVASLKEKVS